MDYSCYGTYLTKYNNLILSQGFCKILFKIMPCISLEYSFTLELFNQFLDSMFNSTLSTSVVLCLDAGSALYIPCLTIVYPVQLMYTAFCFVTDCTSLKIELQRNMSRIVGSEENGEVQGQKNVSSAYVRDGACISD